MEKKTINLSHENKPGKYIKEKLNNRQFLP